MPQERRPGEKRWITAIDGALALIGVLVVVQMWLVTATLDTFLAGHRGAALPAAICSTLLFAGCFSLYRFIVRIDRESRGRGE
ncbi:MAG: hypothetical protein K8T20_20745 [Planctomycetes bacterium]|nr:hypothetical protein [Planctomycetota bacterium]